MSEQAMSVAQVRAYAAERARAFNHRFAIFGAAVLLVLLTFGAILQTQISTQAAFIQEMCQQRKVNAERLSAYYDRLIKIETRSANTPAVQGERIRAFHDAKPIVPTCKET